LRSWLLLLWGSLVVEVGRSIPKAIACGIHGGQQWYLVMEPCLAGWQVGDERSGANLAVTGMILTRESRMRDARWVDSGGHGCRLATLAPWIP
jgi:hypothetical protein